MINHPADVEKALDRARELDRAERDASTKSDIDWTDRLSEALSDAKRAS